jgi:predicted DCC family thiol-disulfide oxidoreductase YuxK
MKPIDTIHSIMNNVVIVRVQRTFPHGTTRVAVNARLGDPLSDGCYFFLRSLRQAVEGSLYDIST